MQWLSVEGRWPWKWLPWLRRPDPLSDHGHRPYAAWEAELGAYARWRTGQALKVRFGLATGAGWSDEIQLARPEPHLSIQEAFAAAELELEHLLAHYRFGWREVALFWHAWARSGEPIRLPWPPWDRVALPPALIRQALGQAIPGLAPPPDTGGWQQRLKDAAFWVAAAAADGIHRELEVAERPGMAERLPVPPAGLKLTVWHAFLLHLASHGQAGVKLPAQLAEPAEALLTAGCGVPLAARDVGAHVTGVTNAVARLARLNALPPSHRQRPAWLHPLWGRWRQAPALQRALDDLTRSPASAEIAAITAAARAGGSLSSAGGLGALGLEAAGLGRRGRGDAAAPETPRARAEVEDLDGQSKWGVPAEAALPERAGSPARTGEPGREGSGQGGIGLSGAGAGHLGALHVVTASESDRAAYWQLRAALAPAIERLIERLEASSDRYYASAPRRFQRDGRLDRSRLPAAAAGRQNVFIRFVHEPQPAHALCLLLDCSASMTLRAELLRESAILVESAAAAVGARVTAFSFGAAWERMEPAAEGAPLLALGRELHPHGGTPFGPAVAAAAEWLSRQPYEQKRLWVFSDGQWSARDRAGTSWRPDLLKDVVVWVLADRLPSPPHPAMRLVAAPTLDELVQLAPQYFWAPAGPLT